MAEVQPPLALQGGAIQHPAILFRRALGGIVGEGVSSYNTGTKRLPNDLKVNENSPAAMSVLVARGGGFVNGDDVQDQGAYFVYNDGNKALTISASDPTNPRKDIVVARIKDNTHGVAGDTWALEIVTGTPAATPAEPTLPPSALKLAVVEVLANATTITTANITDARARVTSDLSSNLIGAVVYRGTNQSIPDVTATPISFGSELSDTDAFHDTSTNPSRLTIPTNFEDWYEVEGQVNFANAAGGGTRQARILVNGAAVGTVRGGQAPTGTTYLQVRAPGGVFLNAGDYVEMDAFQGSGSALDVVGGASNTFLALRRRGPR